MTTFRDYSVTCSVCGQSSQQKFVNSTSVWTGPEQNAE